MLFFILIVLLCFVWSWHKLRYFSSQGIKTLRPVPFFGNLTNVTIGKENFVDAVAAGYEAFSDQRYFGLYQYHMPTVIPRDPDLIREIMVRDFKIFHDRGVHIGPENDSIFGRCLLILKGSRWRETRVSLTPAFSAARSRCMAPLMDECANNVVKYLQQDIDTNTEIDTNIPMSAYVNDVIASCAFGFSVNTMKDPDNCIYRLGQKAIIQHTTQVMKLFGYANFPSLMKFLGVRMISKSATEQFSKLFKAAMKNRRESAEVRPDFIQTLVDAVDGKVKQDIQDDNNNNDSTSWGKKFSDEDLIAQAVLFYIAGFDTTSNLISFFLYEIAMNPDVQEKLYEEIDGANSENVRDIYETVHSLEYLEMVLSEVLRLWPLVGAIDRCTVVPHDFGPTYEGSKHHLVADAGIHIWLPLFSIHRDPKYWESPNKFDPERFAPCNRANIKPYTYLPFGSGPRHCIGSRFAMLTAKVLLFRVLKEFKFSPSSKTAFPQKVAPRAFIMRPENGFNLMIEPRNTRVTTSTF